MAFGVGVTFLGAGVALFPFAGVCARAAVAATQQQDIAAASSMTRKGLAPPARAIFIPRTSAKDAPYVYSLVARRSRKA